MTYENVVSWCERNIPQEEYDSFADWYDACYEKVNTPNLFDNADFNRMMEDSWLGAFGTFERNPIEVSNTPKQTTLPIQEKKELPKEEERKVPQTGQAPTIPKPQLVFPEVQKKESRIQTFKRAFRGLFRR